MSHVDVAIIGAGQAGLSIAYFLRRTNRSFVLLDAEEGPGGAWRHGWPSLRLFSPASWSSIAGWAMPTVKDPRNPSALDVVRYLEAYEDRYKIPVNRPIHVLSVDARSDVLEVWTDKGSWTASAVVSATGTWSNPVQPSYPGAESFRGEQLHSSHYSGPGSFAGRRVLVIGGGNSGAQIYADVAPTANATWVTSEVPRFLPDDVDGRVLFERATERWRAQQEGRRVEQPSGGLGDIVMVPPVRAARERGLLTTVRPFTRMTANGVVWPDGTTEPIDAVLWCTGFLPALSYLDSLGVLEPDGLVQVDGNRSVKQQKLWLVGYGDWTGMASATLIGVMRTARSAALEIDAALEG